MLCERGPAIVDMIDFTVNGQRYRMSRRQVIARMRDVAPEPLSKHAVVINGVRYPVKQVFGQVTGIDRLDFTSQVARRQLARLDFELERM